ncbi:MAG: peptidase protein [Parcubacteria group bacterium]|nr:peptidase protein [Parcubacteria group bacterium]
MKFKKTTLPNGLRIITVPTPGNPSVTILVMVETGSSYEKNEEGGLSHFLEHMCFKGTQKRPNSLSISQELDMIGAENNAFTSNEFTGYYAKGEKRHFTKLLDVLSDVYLNSTFPEAEIEKEKGVIIQEISMYEDMPQRKVAELFMSLIYGDTPAGRPVVGTKEKVQQFSRKDFLNYHKRHYVSEGTIIVVAGDLSDKEVKKEIKEKFKSISTSKKFSKAKISEKQKTPQVLVHNKKTDQTHFIIGFRGFNAHDPRTPAAQILSSILAGGMSSRLFQKLREEMGICYYVQAGSDEYTDHGYFAISVGANANVIPEVVRVILAECAQLANVLVSNEDLKNTKEYMLGHLYMALETTDSLANFYASQEAIKHAVLTPKELEKEIRKVTAQDIQKVAKTLFQNKNLNLAVVGDVHNVEDIKKILSF